MPNIHNAFITFKGAKISKSSGGLYTVFDLEKMGYEPLDYRYLVLGSHYRKGMEFSEENLKAARTARLKLTELVKGELGNINQEWLNKFREKISDDLQMPEVLANLWLMWKSDISVEDKRATTLEMDKVLGLNLNELKAVVTDIPQEISVLAQKRAEAKANKDWAKADELRNEIKNRGYIVEDLADGFKIKSIDK